MRSGNNFTAYYSADDVNWTQLGATVAIASMPTTANVGLTATANFNSQLTSALFANVVIRLAGDVNLDGHVNAADIGAMMQALTDTATYQSTNNLSSADATLVLDANGDGAVTNADLQFLLNRLLSGGSTSNENTIANSVNANAPLVPTLIQSPQIITATNEIVATATDSSSTSNSTPASEALHFVPLTISTEDSSSASSPSPANHSSAISIAPAAKSSSLATVDTYFARFDQASSHLPGKSHHAATANHQAADDCFSESALEPLLASWN